MVDHIRIGDGQHHPSVHRPAIQNVLQINNVGLAVGQVLGVHAVVGGQRQGGAQGVELLEVAVHHGVEVIGRGRSRRVLMLDVIRGRQIHDVGAPGFQQLDPGGEDKLAQIGRIDLRHRKADELIGTLDAVFGFRGPVRLLRRKSHRPAA